MLKLDAEIWGKSKNTYGECKWKRKIWLH